MRADQIRRRIALLSAFAACCVLTSPAALAQAANGGGWTLSDAVGAPGWLTVSGSIRPRYESLSDQLTADSSGGDEMLGLRTFLKAEADGGDVSAVVEILDARRLSGNGGGAAAAQVDAVELLQAHVAWRPIDGVEARLGRFTLDIGSRRLVARSNFSSTPNSFTGADLNWAFANGANLRAFHVAPDTRLPTDDASALDNEVALNPSADTVRFSGVEVRAPVGDAIAAEAYAFLLDENDATNLPTRNRELQTFGARVHRDPSAQRFDFDLEAAWQTGEAQSTTSAPTATSLDIEAAMAHVEGGYTFAAPWSPRIVAMYDYATGDESPDDRRSQRFDALYGDRSFELGPTSLFGVVARTNLSSAAARLEVQPAPRWDAMVALRRVDLADARDAFAGTGVRDPSGAAGRHAGDQVEWRVRHRLARQAVQFEAGGAWFRRGGMMRNAPNAQADDDAIYGYASVLFEF
jgi:hypothetical protein